MLYTVQLFNQRSARIYFTLYGCSIIFHIRYIVHAVLYIYPNKIQLGYALQLVVLSKFSYIGYTLQINRSSSKIYFTVVQSKFSKDTGMLYS